MDPERAVLNVIQYAALVLALCVHEFAHAASASSSSSSTLPFFFVAVVAVGLIAIAMIAEG